MKLFGKDLFEFKREPIEMYDFYKWIKNNPAGSFMPITDLVIEANPRRKSKKKEQKEIKLLTPKALYKMKALNANEFFIKTDKEYIKEQLLVAESKLQLIGKRPKRKKNDSMPGEWGAVTYGREEVESIIERLKNRYKIDEFKDILQEYPHTTSALIADVLEKNKHLQIRESASFVPDLPKDAISAMNKYNDRCVKLFNKKTWFYVIADEKDFNRVANRRDPILLAQSPFGFFWEILGAWDEEVMYLGDL